MKYMFLLIIENSHYDDELYLYEGLGPAIQAAHSKIKKLVENSFGWYEFFISENTTESWPFLATVNGDDWAVSVRRVEVVE